MSKDQRMSKHQTPNTKHQRNTKLQTPGALGSGYCNLVFGISLVFGVWCLVFSYPCSSVPLSGIRG
ncbi:MAG: hypothetical protein C5B50_08120 [Verrucomicrobia bacterium]|nr:MAG: hypothetical protein C5B50_08120 [Verrucomicrobiota bacterium]